MSKLIALAVIQVFLNAGASESRLSLECKQVSLRISEGGSEKRVSIEACEVFVTPDKACRAYWTQAGVTIHCEAQVKPAAGAAVL